MNIQTHIYTILEEFYRWKMLKLIFLELTEADVH